MPDDLREEVQAALIDIQGYLLDQIPPLTASDAIETLMVQPPALLMRQIRAWAAEQSRLQSVAMCDVLFHALRKVHLFGALKLIEREAIDAYLDALTPLAVELCPLDERDSLRSNLAALRDSRNITVAAVDIKRSDVNAPRPQAPRGPATDDMARSARRLSMVIDRLSRKAPAVTAGPEPAGAAPPGDEPLAQLVTMAARSSGTEQELQRYIETLGPYGNTQREGLLRVLAMSLPAWDVVAPPDVAVKPPAPVEAMHKIISLTSDQFESTKRFRELLAAAVEQFNAGSLSASLSMLELAEVVIVEKKIDPGTVERIRTDIVESISAEQLRKYAENKMKHALLRKALMFFPTLTMESLLQQLRGEERPERRRSLLGLLEAYGPFGRDAALAELETELNRPAAEIDTYYLRNVIYLLHRIPRDSDQDAGKEIELLTRASAKGHSIYVIKEAVLPLGQIKTEAAVKLLTTRLAEFEVTLLRKDTSLYPTDEMLKLLDRICSVLARIATPAALLTIARHGMKANPLLGDTRARLAGLAQHDLSFDEKAVTIIVDAIRADLPTKLLGRYLPKRQPPPLRLIEALSGTRSEAVEVLFAELAEKFADHDIGRAAAAAIAALAKRGGPAREGAAAASLTGDLQFFGLPSLMQSLAEMQATGVVTLSSKQGGQTTGKLLFREGGFLDAQTGSLRGPDALYQLLERPVPGTFTFVPRQPTDVNTKQEPVAVMGLLFEGIRRHDELNQTTILVPDDLRLQTTAVKPTPAPDEDDPSVIREVWVKASSGGRVADWEGKVATDAYRVRRLVAHWLEEGALQPVA